MPPRKLPVEPPPEQDATFEDAVLELKDEVRTLREQIEVLVVAIDDVRQEIETAIRHLPREQWVPTQPLVSMPRDMLAEPFPINRTRREDVPTDDRAVPPSPVEPAVAATTPGASGIGELF